VEPKRKRPVDVLKKEMGLDDITVDSTQELVD